MHFTTLALSMLATNAMALQQRWVPHQVIHTKYEVVTVTAPVTIVTEVVHIDPNAPAPVPAPAPVEEVQVQEVKVVKEVKEVKAEPAVEVKEVYVQPTTLIKVAAPKPTVAAASTNSGLTSDQQAALDAHNAARSEVGNAPLTWDDALAADAQTWADHLVAVGSLTHASLEGQGENLYMQSGTDNPCANAVKAFVNEKKDYSGQKIGEGNFGSYGHYTQVVWKSTTKVGMAFASGNGQTFVVARYADPGNFMGSTPY